MNVTNTTEAKNGAEVMAARVVYDLPDPEYRKADGVSNSMLKALRERWCPAHAIARLANPKETTEALAFGKALHSSLLTPNVAKTWVVTPDDAPKRPTKAQQNAKKPKPDTLERINWWKQFDERNRGLDVLDATGGYGGVRLTKTIEAFQNHVMANATIATGAAEVSVFAPYNLGGSVLRKARMDFVTTGDAIVDLKSASDCSPKCVGKRDEFSAQLFDLDYDMQAAYYLDLWNDARPEERKSAFVFVAVDWDEDTEFVGIRVLQCDETVIRSGRDKYVEALAKWIECKAAGRWPNYSEEVTMLSVPEFVERKYRTV